MITPVRLLKFKNSCIKKASGKFRKPVYKPRPLTHFGKAAMGKGLGERATTNN